MVQKDMNILVGVTGGIAAYKTLALIRLLRETGGGGGVVMSDNAARFVTPLSFETVSGAPVSNDPFGSRDNMAHISLRDWADLLVVAPATANFMAKAATGIADDLLSTTALACRCPRIFCPAMNSAMWDAAPTRRNLERLIADGWTAIGPESGGLACGEEGPGRMWIR
jgi:phosphopantothenoylcysteine decarboxylase/phosphopantothenate--cysteine ligase